MNHFFVNRYIKINLRDRCVCDDDRSECNAKKVLFHFFNYQWRLVQAIDKLTVIFKLLKLFDGFLFIVSLSICLADANRRIQYPERCSSSL